jgi:hypothetical protein
MTTKRMSYALRRLQTQRFGDALRGKFPAKQTTLVAARVNAQTVQIGGQYYPGAIDDEAASVVNIGRPASAIYGPAGNGGGAVVVLRGGSSEVGGAGGGGDVASHNLNDDTIHIGQLDRTQATFVATDIAAGIATHAALPDVHHARVSSANSGIAVSGSQALTLTLATNPGLEIASGLRLGTPGNSGAQTANQVSTASHAHAIVGYSDGALHPSELTKFDSGGGIAPYYLTTNTINTASGNLTITPAGTGTFTPSAKALGSSVHVPGLLGDGWRISERDGIAGLSHLDIRSIYSDELIVKSFIADIVRVRMGEDWLTYSMGIVTANNTGVNFVTPAVGSSARLYIENSPFVTGALYADNEWVLLDILNRDGGGLVKAYIWGQVSSYIEEADNRQSWLFVNRQGIAGIVVDPGVAALSFGLSGQGYIHRSVVDPDSPFIRVSTWSGANPYTPANRTVHVQIGDLDGVDWSPYFEPSGWGIFADNAYLQGSLVAAAGDLWASTDGLNIQAGNTQGVYSDWPLHLTWAADPAEPTLAGQVFQVWGERFSDTNRGVIETLAGTGTGITNSRVIVRARRVDEAGGAVLDLNAFDIESVINLNAINPDGVTKGRIILNGNVTLGGDTDAIVSAPAIRPSTAGATNLGTAGVPWGTLYVNDIVAETITGTTALGGSIWQYDGNMVIRSVSSSAARTLSIANPGTGLMHVDVEGNITVGGTVDGTDIASFHSDYVTHAGDVNAHHNQNHVLASTVALGPDHSVTGLSAGHVLKALTATSAAFGFLAHSQLSSVTANQHHNQNHVLATTTGLGPDHSVSGLTAGQVLRATSAGAARFVQLQHDDLGGVTADQHHPRVHSIVGSDHTITGSQYQIVGATATNTLGLLTPSFNPGAGAAILRTTTSGGLTLKTLTVQGNVDITTGGDLTVGANILFVDASGTNVGINRAPDPQFDLDVNGNLRAGGWIVGKHAIQVDGATMIVHYDAGDGEKISVQGEPTGHFGQPATASGNVLYGPGKFGGKALQVAQNFSPVATNTFEVDTEGYTILNNTTSILPSSSYAIHGDKSLRIEGAGAASGIVRSNFITVSSNTNYSASVYWRCDYNTQLVITEYNASNVVIASRLAGQIAPDGWQRQTVTWTTGATCAKVRVYLYHYNMPAGQYAYVDAVQLTQSTYSLPFTDQASHTRDYLDYNPGGVINLPKGTVMTWVKPDGVTGSNGYILSTGTTGTEIRLLLNAAGNWSSGVGGSTGAGGVAAVQDWTHLALTWDGATARLYVNGTEATNYSYTNASGALGTVLRIGNYVSATSSLAFNGWIDEVAILDRAAPASEILAIYESDAPVFAETSVFSFRVGASLVWGDNEGLWTRDTDGTAAFAVVGVDGKSWGGVTLDKGDVMIGNSTHGYLQYDRSAGAMKLVDTDLTLYYGNANRNKIKFINGETTVGEIHAYDFGSGAALGIWSYPLNGGSASELFLGTKTLAGAINGYIAILDSTINMLGSVSFGGGNVTVQGANQLRLSSAPLASYGAWAHFRRSAGSVPTDPTSTAFFKIDQDSTTGAMATLELRQNDNSEEFIYFNGNFGSILTTALGSYAGRVRVSVAGLPGFYWIPFYN